MVPMPRIGIAALLALALLAPAAAAHDGELPDLVSDPVSGPKLEVDASEGSPDRLLLRFHSWVHNDGAGPLEVRRPVAGDPEQVFRNASLEDVFSDPLGEGDLKFEDTDGHNHWHLQRIAQYSLVSSDGSGSLVAPSMKAGFCLLDSDDVADRTGRVYWSQCGRNEPNPTEAVVMGVSSGWRDLYDRSLPFQWVDVSEVLPGSYTLRSVADPENVVEELVEDNIPADLPNQVVPGFRATPEVVAPGAVTLTAAAFGAVSAPRFKVVDPPDRGSLDVPTGAWLGSPNVIYTGAGADRFVVVAANPASPFPRYPGRATVLVGGSGERVALSGVPETMLTGVTVDLDALVVGGGAPTWSADGATVDADGRLTAPSTPGTITVTATGPSGERDTMVVRVVAQPDQEPAPTVPDNPAGGAIVPTTSPTAPALPVPRATPTVTAKKRTPIGSVRVRRIGRQYAVSVVPRTAGRLRATLLKGTRRLATCTVRVAARKSALCRLKVRPGATAIALTLVRTRGGTEHRRVRAPR